MNTVINVAIGGGTLPFDFAVGSATLDKLGLPLFLTGKLRTSTIQDLTITVYKCNNGADPCYNSSITFERWVRWTCVADGQSDDALFGTFAQLTTLVEDHDVSLTINALKLVQWVKFTHTVHIPSRL